MKEKIRKHWLYYAVFILMQVVGLGLLILTGSNKSWQFVVICFMTVCYFVWATAHHYIHHNLTPKIVVEYMLIGILGAVISVFTLP